jgi:3-oxoadipate enol-lactonase
VTPPRLVLLHGLGTGPSAWTPQIEAFAGEREVIAPLLLLDLDGAVRQVHDIADAEKAVDLCGLSLGALVALRVAIERPQRVRRLVLAAGFARLPRRLRALQLLLGGAIRVLPRRALVRGLASAVPRPYRADAERALAHASPAAVSRVMRAGARYDVTAAAERLDVPTLVVCGERDRHNVPLSRGLAELLPRAELRLVSNAGHVVNLEQPEAFNALLREFLSGEDVDLRP